MNILVLTDSLHHSINNSLYGLVSAISSHKEVNKVDICDRYQSGNAAFFTGHDQRTIWISQGNPSFKFSDLSDPNLSLKQTYLSDYDCLFLRVPRPIPQLFFDELIDHFDADKIVNHPIGIQKTSNKKYLLNFPEFTPRMELCQTWEQIEAFREVGPCVLKPLESYGGKGIVKMHLNNVESENERMTLSEFKMIYQEQPMDYLAVEYLKNVVKGDKRIFVAGGNILFSTLRKPGENGWLCNVAQGGSSTLSVTSKNERKIVDYLTKVLKREKIFYYGLDTLIDNKGRRVISEINTLSIGGITPSEKDQRMLLSKRFAKLLIDHFKTLLHDEL